MSPVEFEPTIPTIERPQIHASDREATGIRSSFLMDKSIAELMRRSDTWRGEAYVSHLEVADHFKIYLKAEASDRTSPCEMGGRRSSSIHTDF